MAFMNTIYSQRISSMLLCSLWLMLCFLIQPEMAQAVMQYPSIRETILQEKPVDPTTWRINHEVVVFDLWKYFEQAGIKDLHAQVDVVYLVTALQGIVNRDQPRLYLLASLALFDIETKLAYKPNLQTLPVTELDVFWWTELERKGIFTKVHRTSDLAELIRIFRPEVAGLVRWEMKVPATVNGSLMAAGCEKLLPVSSDLADGRLRTWLSTQFPDLPLKMDLADRFNGKDPVVVNDHSYPSSGSAKNDVYRFAIEKFLRNGPIDPSYFWYDCDAAMWGKLRNVYSANAYGHLGSRAELQHNGMFNTDYWVARRGVIFDLYPWGDTTPNDDPEQPVGTDLATWNELMNLSYQRRNGEFGVLGGFVPWWIKYTDAVGGKHGGVASEWAFIALGTSYNLVNEGDAAFGISNASFFMHLPQLTPRELLAPPLKEVPYRMGTTYIAFCMMDYDGSAWVNQMVTSVYNDPARGKVPLNWCINPIIHRRIPQALRYMYERRTPNDFFGFADDGIGYLDPLALSERRGLVKENGIDAYERFAQTVNQRYGYDITPYYIAPRFASPWIDMAARIDKGFGYNAPMSDTLVNGTPAVSLPFFHVHQPQNLEAEVRQVFQQALGRKGFNPTFKAYRCVLITPSMIAGIMEKMGAEFPNAQVEVVDLRNFFRLVKTKLSQPLTSPYRDATELVADAGNSKGIVATQASGGAFQVQHVQGIPAWVAEHQENGLYLYFDIDDAFVQRIAGHPIELTITYCDLGQGELELQYDSRDPAAPLDGAYKAAAQKMPLKNSGQWQTATFQLPDARFENRQNSATDLRIFRSANDKMIIKAIKLRPASAAGTDHK
jgi:hypothetical protein